LGETERAKEWAERALLLDPDNINLRYNLGCSMIQIGELDAGMDLIEAVFGKAQPQGLQWMTNDSDLDPIKQMPRYKAMVASAEARLGLSAAKAAQH
jgi:adenylate cyclase